MELHYTLRDEIFVEGFEKCTMDPSWFTHQAHLRIAYLYLEKYGAKIAARRLCKRIENFDRTFGSGKKYHCTITMASVGIVDHFVRKSSGDSFISLINEFPVLKDDFKKLLFSHYSRHLIDLPESKLNYFLPDIEPNIVFEQMV